MRAASLTALFVASAIAACSTFSASEEKGTPPPPADGGSEAAPPRATCEPVVFDPAAGSACPGVDLTQPENCGACGHACVDAKCVDRRCEGELLTGPQPIVAIDGTKAYAPLGSTIVRADLTKPAPVTFEPYFDNQTGKVNHLEVYAGKLYIGWDNNQTVLVLSDVPAPEENVGFKAVETDRIDGHYLPGATSYYLFPDNTAGVNLARIAPNAPVDKKQKSSFLPIARSGDDIFWTEKLGTGGSANLVGPWERADAPIAIVDADIQAFAAEGDTAFIASGGFLSRATRGAEVKRLAIEPGVGVAFAIDGDQLFYAVKRLVDGQERHQLYRIDKCKGGEPVPLVDVNYEITAIALNEPTHVIVNTAKGLFRTRR